MWQDVCFSKIARQHADDKAELKEQEQQIGQYYKKNSIKKQFGQLSGGKILKPITKQLDRPTKDLELPEEPAKELNYRMDEFDRLNPFYDDDFKPDAETPPLTRHPSPPASQVKEEGKEEAGVPPPKTWGKPAATNFLESSNESVDLQTVGQLITKY